MNYWQFSDHVNPNVHETDVEGKTPLHLAAECTKLDDVKRFLEQGIVHEKEADSGAGTASGAGRMAGAGTASGTGKSAEAGTAHSAGKTAGAGKAPGAGPLAKKDDAFKRRSQAVFAAEKELMEIFERTYGPVRPRAGADADPFRETGYSGGSSGGGRTDGTSGAAGISEKKSGGNRKPQPQQDHYLLVDGYNIIFAWEDLRELAMSDIKAARDSLMDILSNFAGYRSEKIILVFDAYKVAGGPGEVIRWHNIDVVFTKEAETADLDIEKTAHVLAKKYRVTVATSDAVEQIIIFGAGAYRMSARMLLEEIIVTGQQMRERYGIGTDE